MTLPVTVIDRLAFGGSGVCRIDGKVCFVPRSCPGDRVSLRIIASKKSYSTAAIADVITPSADRVAPECPIFDSCGGCAWQHISYPVQLEQKRAILAEALRKGAGIPVERVDGVVAACDRFGYRSRMQFKTALRNGTLQIGFYRTGSHQVVNAADGCPVAVPVINRAVECLRPILSTYPAVGSVTQVSIDAGESGIIVIIHHSGAITSRNRSFFTSRGGDFGPCTGLFLAVDDRRPELVWGVPEISYSMARLNPDQPPLRLLYPPGGFAQVHQRQNRAMLALVRELGQFAPGERLLDLYCGNGNFTLPLSGDAASLVGIEGSADAIRSAEENKLINAVANVDFFCDDVAAGVGRLVVEGHRFDTVLLDPPRAGAADALEGIAALQPEKIIYVSCDPSTLARDCGALTGYGFRVVRSVPVDMFPQTYHIESVTLLIREP